MAEVQAPYFDAVERVDALRQDRKIPAGYERNYKRGRLFVTVCPWHWRMYSHYQFWEVLASAHLAKLDGAAATALVTKGEWTPWCLDGFAAAFDHLIVSESAAEAAGEVEQLLDARLEPGREVPEPVPGRVFFGKTRRSATTVVLKRSLLQGLSMAGERAGRPGRAAPYFPGLASIGFHHRLSNGWIVHAKGFRNPDPAHELKMLAGKAFAVGPSRAARLVYVVDGRLTAADAEVIARSGAHVTTPDRYREAVGELWSGEQRSVRRLA